VMIDCGYRADPHWWPSVHLLGQGIDVLALTNLDEDHVGDFKDVRKNLKIGSVWMNNTIDAARLRGMKPEGMQDGVKSLLGYLRAPLALNLSVDLTPMVLSLFRNPYGVFRDTNNLSLVVFVEYGRFCVVFPGDLEEDGWKQLLPNPDFQALLRRTDLFMTSHHGRGSGCCTQVFQICHPHAFVISDKEIVHDTQQTAAWYREHAYGLEKRLKTPWETPETRYVFTTRKDHCMSITADLTGNFVLRVNSDRQGRPSLGALPGR